MSDKNDDDYYRLIAEQLSYLVCYKSDDPIKREEQARIVAQTFISQQVAFYGTHDALPYLEFPFRKKGEGEPVGILEWLNATKE